MDNDNFAVVEKSKTPLNTSIILSLICVPLMIIQSIIGLFISGTYEKDGTIGRAIWQGNDVVNLFLFVPLLLIAIVLAKRGTDKGRIFWLGMQALVTYDYLYYPLAVAYDKYFLLYLAIFGISFFSFVFGITRIDFSKYTKYLPGKRSSVVVSVFMLFFAAILSLMWIGLSILNIFTGEVKIAGQSMISTFDLILITPPVILSVIWLLKGQARGYVILTVMSILCGLYCFILMAYTPFALKADLSDAWTMLPLWILLCALCIPTMFILLFNKKQIRSIFRN